MKCKLATKISWAQESRFGYSQTGSEGQLKWRTVLGCSSVYFFRLKKPSRRPMIDRTRGIKGFRPWNPRLGSPVLCRGTEGECERMANKITVSLWLLNGLELSLSLNQLEMFIPSDISNPLQAFEDTLGQEVTLVLRMLRVISHQLIMPWPSVTVCKR